MNKELYEKIGRYKVEHIRSLYELEKALDNWNSHPENITEGLKFFHPFFFNYGSYYLDVCYWQYTNEYSIHQYDNGPLKETIYLSHNDHINFNELYHAVRVELKNYFYTEIDKLISEVMFKEHDLIYLVKDYDNEYD